MFLGPDSTPTCTPFKILFRYPTKKRNRTTPAYLNNLPQASSQQNFTNKKTLSQVTADSSSKVAKLIKTFALRILLDLPPNNVTAPALCVSLSDQPRPYFNSHTPLHLNLDDLQDCKATDGRGSVFYSYLNKSSCRKT